MGTVLMVAMIVTAILSSVGVGVLAIKGFVSVVSRHIPK